MTRHIVLDVETTGKYAEHGDRVIEIACVELIDRKLTGNDFFSRVNPERDIPEEATAVHGLTLTDLVDAPKFGAVAPDLINYLQGARLVIHQARFDVGFLNKELDLANMGDIKIDEICSIIDTVRLAKEALPGKKVNLDALCDHYGIDNSNRKKHSALLDAQLLASVFLNLTQEKTESPRRNIDRRQLELGSSAAGKTRVGSATKVSGTGRWRPPPPRSTPYITPEGYEALGTELRERWELRTEVTKALGAAAAEGDRSENAEYIYRKKQLGEIDRRIRYLQKRLPSLTIVREVADASSVFFGAEVTLEKEDETEVTYRIVGPDETNAKKGWISIDSPLARALLKKKIDDDVVLAIGEEPSEFVVLAISYPSSMAG